MKARVLTTASLLSALAGALPAADPQLMKLVMPDVKVMSDVNVQQAKLSPFGQFLLSQMQSKDLEQFAIQTGFDPRLDLTELMVVSNGTPGPNSPLALASGNFNTSKISAVAQANGATTEVYKGITILDNPKKTAGVAFLSTTVLIAGSLPNVKAAIDRNSAPATLPPSLITQANQLSVTQDAWTLSTVSPASLIPAGANKAGVGGMTVPANVLQQVQSASAGVKFGANVTVTAQAQTDTADNATALVNLLQLVGNIAQMQAGQNANAAAFAKSLTATANGSTINISASLPEAQFQELLTPRATVNRHLQGGGK